MTRTHGRRFQPAAHKVHHTRVAKENVAPARKDAASTTEMFKAANDRIRKRKMEKSASTTSTKPISLGKSILSRRTPSPPPIRPPKPETHPLLSNLSGKLSEYRDNVTTASESALEPVYELLLKRLAQGEDLSEGTDSNLATQFAKALQLSNTISKPLGEQQVKVRFKHKNGSSTLTHIPLGETAMRFRKLFGDKKRELEGLWESWDQVRQEISELGAELREKESEDPADEHISELRQQVRDACEQSRAEVEKLAQEEAQTRKVKRDQWLDLLKKEL